MSEIDEMTETPSHVDPAGSPEDERPAWPHPPAPAAAKSGALLECLYCYRQYATKAMLMGHMRVAHYVLSNNPASARRQAQREVARGVSRAHVVRDPPPVPRGLTPHQPLRARKKLDAGELEQLRKWLLYAVHQQYARRLDVQAAVVIDGISLLCLRNFSEPPIARRAVDVTEL